MNRLFWKIVARIVCMPAIFEWLVKRGERTPYRHITSSDGGEVYMYRYWLFNAYGNEGSGTTPPRWPFLPSIRLHHIMRKDYDRDLHDHPWNARTIILSGYYVEQRETKPNVITRWHGETCTLKHGEYHRILIVPTGGVWTLFFTWRYRGTWGFKVNGVKVPWRLYLGEDKPTELAEPERKHY